jgi:plasmid stabilization system protein ParE
LSSFRLIYQPGVANQVRAAFDWYLENAPEQAERFVDDLDAAEASIKRFPRAFRYDEDLEARRIGLESFPYLLWFDVEGTVIQVLALTHEGRGPAAVREAMHPK